MDRPLRILHVQHSLHPGGMENGVVNVARALQPRGFEFHVACLSTSGGFAERLPDPSLVHALGKPPGFSRATVNRLRQLIRGVGPDVVHSHNLGALIYAAFATSFGRDRPILHGEHGTPDEGARSRMRHLQRRILFKAARKVHTVSQGLYEHFVRSGFDRSRLLPLINGVDTERFEPADKKAARMRLNLPEGAPVLLIVGRLIASKRHILLFDAFAQLTATHPDAVLLVLGDGGPDREAIHEAAGMSHASDRIRMEGFKEDPRPYYHAADLLVAPSRVEGLSNAVLEAMACGLPALLADACGNRDVIEDGVDGMIRPLESSAELASSIRMLLADRPRLEKYGTSARNKVVTSYSLGSMADAYEQTYRRLAAETR